MTKVTKKNLGKILAKARKNNFKNENKKAPKITKSVLDNLDREDANLFEKRFNWKHQPGDLGYLSADYKGFQKEDVLLVIKESKVNYSRYSKYKENYFYILINYEVVIVPGSYIRCFD